MTINNYFLAFGLIFLISYLLQFQLHGQCTDNTHSTNINDQWISCQTSVSPNSANGTGHWVMYDLGFVYNLTQTTFWNYNVSGQTSQGFKEVIVSHSIDGLNWTQATQFQLPQASGLGSYSGFNGPNLNGISARYILIFAQSTWNGGNCAGFSEFRADIIPTPTCPNGDNNQDGICDFVEVNLRALLEGAMENNGLNEMRTDLNNSNLIPLNQPYGSYPYYYTNSVSITAYPTNAVDWIMVEARTGTPAISGLPQTNLIERQVGFIDKDGYIIDPSGNGGLKFENIIEGNSYYFALRHRNHLDVFTSTSLTVNNLLISHDFTTSSSQAFGNNQMKISPNGNAYMLYAGDYDQDGVIQILDFDVWQINPAVLMSYEKADGNLDGVIQTTDYDQWYTNQAKLGIGEIQY